MAVRLLLRSCHCMDKNALWFIIASKTKESQVVGATFKASAVQHWPTWPREKHRQVCLLPRGWCPRRRLSTVSLFLLSYHCFPILGPSSAYSPEQGRVISTGMGPASQEPRQIQKQRGAAHMTKSTCSLAPSFLTGSLRWDHFPVVILLLSSLWFACCWYPGGWRSPTSLLTLSLSTHYFLFSVHTFTAHSPEQGTTPSLLWCCLCGRVLFPRICMHYLV